MHTDTGVGAGGVNGGRGGEEIYVKLQTIITNKGKSTGRCSCESDQTSSNAFPSLAWQGSETPRSAELTLPRLQPSVPIGSLRLTQTPRERPRQTQTQALQTPTGPPRGATYSPGAAPGNAGDRPPHPPSPRVLSPAPGGRETAQAADRKRRSQSSCPPVIGPQTSASAPAGPPPREGSLLRPPLPSGPESAAGTHASPSLPWARPCWRRPHYIAHEPAGDAGRSHNPLRLPVLLIPLSLRRGFGEYIFLPDSEHSYVGK